MGPRRGVLGLGAASPPIVQRWKASPSSGRRTPIYPAARRPGMLRLVEQLAHGVIPNGLPARDVPRVAGIARGRPRDPP